MCGVCHSYALCFKKDKTSRSQLRCEAIRHKFCLTAVNFSQFLPHTSFILSIIFFLSYIFQTFYSIWFFFLDISLSRSPRIYIIWKLYAFYRQFLRRFFWYDTFEFDPRRGLTTLSLPLPGLINRIFPWWTFFEPTTSLPFIFEMEER